MEQHRPHDMVRASQDRCRLLRVTMGLGQHRCRHRVITNGIVKTPVIVIHVIAERFDVIIAI